MSVKRKESLKVLAQNLYLSVLQVPVDVLDQLPHCFLQAPEQLLLSVKRFVSHLWRWSIVVLTSTKLSFFWLETSLIYLWFNSGEDLEISGKSVAFFTDGVDVELVQFTPQRAFVLHPFILHHCKQNWNALILRTCLGVRLCARNLTDVLASSEFVDVDVYDLGRGEGLLQRPVVWVVFGRGLPKLTEQQRVLHNSLHWFDEQRTHVQQVGFPSANNDRGVTIGLIF